jgi:hypothetical protein
MGGWVRILYGGVGSSFDAQSFTFSLATSGVQNMAGIFHDGDQFEIFNFGS